MSIAVPPGVLPGQTLAVKVPDGRELHVVVPKDAGQELLEATGSRWKCGMGATNRRVQWCKVMELWNMNGSNILWKYSDTTG